MTNDDIEREAQKLAVSLREQDAPEELVKLALLLAELASSVKETSKQ